MSRTLQLARRATGYSVEDAYFHVLEQEKIEELRSKKSPGLRLIQGGKGQSGKNEDGRAPPGQQASRDQGSRKRAA